MCVRTLLEATRGYIEFRLLWDENFNLASLNHAVLEGRERSNEKDEMVVEALSLLRSVTTALGTSTHDVFPPQEAISILELALDSLT